MLYNANQNACVQALEEKLPEGYVEPVELGIVFLRKRMVSVRQHPLATLAKPSNTLPVSKATMASAEYFHWQGMMRHELVEDLAVLSEDLKNNIQACLPGLDVQWKVLIQYSPYWNGPGKTRCCLGCVITPAICTTRPYPVDFPASHVIES